MKRLQRFPLVPAILIAALTAAVSVSTIHSAARPAITPMYSVSAVGPTGGAYKPAAINSAGQIVGLDGSGAPFYIDSGTTYHPTSPPGASCWSLTGLNNLGRVAGYIKTGPGCTAPIEAVTGMISGPDLGIQMLEDTLGNPGTGCAAISVNDANQIVGVCNQGAILGEVVWTRIGGGYGSAVALSWPAHTAAPPAMLSRPPAATRVIDQYGDIIGQARCAANHRTSIVVVWSAAHHGMVPHNLGSDACHSPASNTVPTFGAAVASNVMGTSGPVRIAGSCRVFGSGSTQKNTPCLWKLHYSSGHLMLGAPARLDSSTGSKFARAVDVNPSGWIIGDRGNHANTSTLWVPHGAGHTAYSLNSLAGSAAWAYPGPCDNGYGPAAMNMAADIVGQAENPEAGTGYLLTRAVGMIPFRLPRKAGPSPATPSRARGGVTGSGCQF